MTDRKDRPCALTLAPLLLLAASCGQAGSSPGYALPVGANSGGGAFGGTDATPSGRLEVSATSTTPMICPGQCVALAATASGGTPPYSYSWSPAASTDGGATEACPDATTTYEVTATDDSTRAGEVPQPNETASARVTVVVAPECSDAGGASGCDSLAASFVASGSGANPVGPWAYGSTPTLGGTFAPYATFLSASDVDAGFADGLAQWFDVTGTSQLGLGNLPRLAFNPTAMALHPPAGLAGTAYTVAPGQIDLGPGPLGDYSVARWTARASGTYSVHAAFVGLCGYNGYPMTTSDVHVQHNGEDVATGSLNLDGGGNAFTFSSTIAVVAGDTIDFAIANGGNGYLYDDTGLDAVVCGARAGDGG
jgi:hypothetical protein